jgi:uncharacterized membrane protein
MQQSRFKSAILWMSTVANLAIIVGILWPTLNVEPYVRIIGVIIAMLVEFGILNNPTKKKDLTVFRIKRKKKKYR